MTYYEIVNTVSEHNSRVISRWKTLELAKEALKDCADWYRSKGTGRIVEVKVLSDENGKISIIRDEVYSK